MTQHPSSERLQHPVPQRGTLYLSAPLAQTRDKLTSVLRQAGLSSFEPHPNVVAAALTPGSLRQLASVAGRQLNEMEHCDSKCCVIAEGSQPTPADFMQTQSLATLLASVDGEWLLEVLRHERLVTHFQPIVHATDPSSVFAYECLLRGEQFDRQTICPDRLYSAARATGLLMQLDRIARLTAIRSALSANLQTNVFINFNPNSIYDPVHCLQGTVGATQATGFSPERFVFEVVESDEIRETDRLLQIIDYYRGAGFRVALDDLGAGYSSLNLLTQLKPDFIKLDMGLIRNVDNDRYKGQVAAKLLELAKELGIWTVVEGVETLGEWQWAREHGADYAQGFFFARPAAVPPVPFAGGLRPLAAPIEPAIDLSWPVIAVSSS